MTTSTLTAFQLAVLTAIDNSEYGTDSLTDEIWTFSVAQNMPAGGPAGRQIPGVVSSLVKKGLVRTGGSGSDQVIQMTREGVAAYIAARGSPSRKPA